MPRLNVPFYRSQKNCWYGRIHGRILSLGVKSRGDRKAAMEEFARKLLDRPTAEAVVKAPLVSTEVAIARSSSPTVPASTVKSVIDQFLFDAPGRMSSGCLRNYRLFLLPLSAAIGSQPSDTVTAHQIEAFANRPKWSSTYRSNFLAAVTTCFRWAVRRHLLLTNPLPSLTRPPKNSRGADATIDATEFSALLRHTNPLFRDYLKMLWATGGRPGEIAGLTAEMVNEAKDGVILLSHHKTSHRGRTRLLILTDGALQVARRRARLVRTGLLFPGQSGRLTANAIGSI